MPPSSLPRPPEADAAPGDPDRAQQWLDALQYLRVPEIRRLLQQGVDVNRPLPGGLYPPAYVVAPFGGSLEALRVLVEAGADLTLPGNTPGDLIAACHRGVSSAGEADAADRIEAYLRGLGAG